MKKICFTVVLGIIGLTILSGCEDPSAVGRAPDRSPWVKTNTDPLMIELPGAGISVAMNQTIRRDGREYIAGTYTRRNTQGAAERGIVLADTQAGTTISNTEDLLPGINMYAVPFSISNQGSGIFYYVGLFALNKANSKRVHLDSYFLGDRVQNIQLVDAGRAVKVSFLKHALDQSFADDPTEEAFVNLYIEKDMTLQPYVGMHPSWDRNHDGINDCERDGTCDDSVDYTLARQLIYPNVLQQ